MKRFRFRLSGLERIRRGTVDRAYAQLARSERERRHGEEEIMHWDAAIAEGTGRISRQGRVDAAALANEARDLGTLRDRRHSASQRLEGWISAVEADQQRLSRSRQELKAVERLREQRFLEFVREVLREETREIDEVAAVRHQRRALKEAA